MRYILQDKDPRLQHVIGRRSGNEVALGGDSIAQGRSVKLQEKLTKGLKGALVSDAMVSMQKSVNKLPEFIIIGEILRKGLEVVFASQRLVVGQKFMEMICHDFLPWPREPDDFQK